MGFVGEEVEKEEIDCITYLSTDICEVMGIRITWSWRIFR